MIISSQEKTLFGKVNGTNITGWTCNVELFQFLKSMKEGQFGWIVVRFPDGFTTNSHFRVDMDGEPRFTNARLDPAYCHLVIQQLGHKAGLLLIGDKLEV